MRGQARRALVLAAALALTLLVTGLIVLNPRAQKVPPPTKLPEKSIAVLPFNTVGNEADDGYLADGIQDDVLTDLTRVPQLKVISRHSVAEYKHTQKSIREIREALHVDHVLEGSVRRVEGGIRVTAALIDTHTERQTWAETFDRNLAELAQIQNDISQAIATQLKAALSPAARAAIDERPTRDAQAYDLYLKARAVAANRLATTANVEDERCVKAVTLLEAAIARDPDFALAYCQLSDAQLRLYAIRKWDKPWLIKAKQSVDAALRISPESAEAHFALTRYFLYSQDTDAAEKELTIAAAALPGRVDVLQTRAAIEQIRGRWKEALRDWTRAFELDPLNAQAGTAVADTYISLRRYAEAEKLIDQLIANTPQQAIGPFCRYKSKIAVARGDTRAAMAALDAHPQRHIGLLGLNMLVAHVFMIDRDYSKAGEVLQSLNQTAEKHNQLEIISNRTYAKGQVLEQLGRIARFRGEAEQARSYFEQARPGFEAWLARNPAESSVWEARSRGYLAEIDAALGKKEEAVREATDLLNAWPITRDRTVAPDLIVFAAVVHLWTGDRAAALQQLSRAIKLPSDPSPSGPASLCVGDLKLNPIWDELRTDARFAAIVSDAARPPAYN